MFLSCRTPEKSTRIADLEVCGWLLCPVFKLEKKPTIIHKFILASAAAYQLNQ